MRCLEDISMPGGHRRGVAVGNVGRLVGVGVDFRLLKPWVDEITQRI